VIKGENLGRGIPISKVRPPPSRANLCASKSGYKLYGNKYCYKVVYERLLLWQDAYQVCENDKTHLAIINSQDEFNVMHALSNDLDDFWVIKFFKSI